MFVYPPSCFVSNCLSDQVKHVRSEVDEVVAAYYGNTDIIHLAEELCDVVHSSETGLRILADRYGVDVPAVQDYVVEKNRLRGYYDQGGSHG